MLTILHGDYTEASRAELTRQIHAAKDCDVRTLSGNVTANDLTQALESSSLFGGDTLVVLENIFTRLGKKQRQAEEFAAIVRNAPAETKVLIWESKELSAAAVKRLGKAGVRLFKMPAVIFKLLDSLAPDSAALTLGYLTTLIRTEPPEIIYAMVLRRIRLLMQIVDRADVDRLAPWQLARLTRQADLFTMDQLLRLHDSLYTMDIAIKTGATPFSLTQHLEQFLISV